MSAVAGMSLAGRGVPGSRPAFVCLVCLLMAASGSAILNVVLERKTDALMARVEHRNYCLSSVGTVRAVVAAVLLIVASLVASLKYLNVTCFYLLLLAVISYVLLYTVVLKKRTPYAVLMGAVPGALPVLIGYSAIRPDIGLDGMALFSVMLVWQQPHFMALAMKYKDEYGYAGLPVMPLTLGEDYTKLFAFAYAVSLLPLTLSIYVFGYCSAWYAAFAVAATAAFLVSYYKDMARQKRYGRAFGSSVVYIIAVLSSVIVDAAFK